MSMTVDLDAELKRLKDFQRETVEYAFAQLFRDQEARRFLVADEVGLGKTMVARGLIALAIDHLTRKEGVERIDVVYVCSNQDIARQNIRRLNVTGRDEVALASRITLLPLEARKLRDNDINLISLTPGTSLDPRSSLGVVTERAVLYWMLRAALGFRRSKKGALRALRGDAGMGSFMSCVEWLDPDHGSEEIDPGLTHDFAAALRRNRKLAGEFDALCDRMSARHEDNHFWTDELREHRRQVVSELRSLLAQVCISALEPDLVILDEFQRFRDLLDDRETPAGELAHQLFTWRDSRTRIPARLLLLSATPYRMYTLAHEHETDDHQQDFMRTVRFLCGEDEAAAKRIADALAANKRALMNTGNLDLDQIRASRRRVERELGKFMCRTERLAVRDDRDGMLEHRDVSAPLTPRDVRGYLALQELARLLDEPDTVEYWKSAPYLLNFMEGYRFKTRLKDGAASPRLTRELASAIADRLPTLPWDAFERYADIDPGNPRMRSIFADVIHNNVWQALWIAPTLPYYELGGPYADEQVARYTKRLVFSSWNVVPRAIAGLLTYAAERNMVRLLDKEPRNTPQAREQRAQLLTFRISEGRFSSMPVLALLYPSIALATTVDPLTYARANAKRDERATAPGLLAWVAEHLKPLIATLPDTGNGLRGPVDPTSHPYMWHGPEPESVTPEWALHLAYNDRFTKLSRMTVAQLLDGSFRREDLDLLISIASQTNTPTARAFAGLCTQARLHLQGERVESAPSRDIADESWYWAAPILLDLQTDAQATRAWWSRDNLADLWSGQTTEEADSRWADHVERARRLIRGEITLGRKPEDLNAVLAQLAVAGWGTVAARALARVTGGTGHNRVELRDASGQVAWGLRSLFNVPEVTAMIRSPDTRTAYWRHVLRYTIDGCLQAVLDEYAHLLVDDRGLFDSKPTRRWRVLAETMREALALRATRVRVDRIEADSSRGVELTPHNMRTHFASRFADERQEEGKGAVRATHLRTAFNSPFWPFVLASTSVGQEGLDFHLYSHVIVHWNLPSNPVDLEQREGRIHRFKNHAVRRNLAQAYRSDALGANAPDVWEALFEHAVSSRPQGGNDLIPYWVFPVPGGARIERHVPTLPLSRDRAKIEALRRSLTVYRLAFGHARQEDLVAYLIERFGPSDAQRLAEDLAIDLSPANLDGHGVAGAAIPS